MDKIKIGKYLRQLRKNKIGKNGKSFTQNDLANEFCKENSYITINAINEWEKGKTLPSVDNLKILSKIYNKKIDEILDGEDERQIDYSKEYFIYNDNWMDCVDEKNKLFSMRQEQILKIRSRFKELSITAIHRTLSSSEEKEYKFLFENFYKLTHYHYRYCNIKLNNKYLRFINSINCIKTKVKNMSDDEKYWEIQKLYTEKENIRFSHWRDMLDLISEVKIIQRSFEQIENWQKDMFLAMFQNIEAYDMEPYKWGSDFLKRYEAVNGEYDHDQIVKDEMKYLINHGACYNGYFLNYIQIKKEERRIIDRLEELYDLCLKPIEITTNNPNTNITEIYKVENTIKNRFIDKYYRTLSDFLRIIEQTDYSYSDLQEVFDYFISHDEIDDATRLRIAKESGIDTNREKKYWKADYNQRFSYFEKEYIKFKEKEKEIEKGLKEIIKYEEMLSDGKITYQEEVEKIIGGNNEESIRDFIEVRKSNIDYQTFIKMRDKTITMNLLEDLDKLSLKEIKGKYFKMEEVENE